MFSIFPRLYGCLLILVSGNGLRLFVILVLCGGAASCREQGAASQELPPDEIGLALSGLNYTDMPIGVMYVNGSWLVALMLTADVAVLREVWGFPIRGGLVQKSLSNGATMSYLTRILQLCIPRRLKFLVMR